jgi:lysophospholipase L1-like esterase
MPEGLRPQTQFFELWSKVKHVENKKGRNPIVILTFLVLASFLLSTVFIFNIFHFRPKSELPQQPLRILALGDSLTAGFYGGAYYPYAIPLAALFKSAKISAKIDQLGVCGEHVVPTMVNRLRSILETNTSYDWIIILGGTNDLGSEVLAEKIFKEGLEPMYEMCLNHAKAKIKLAAMTVIEISSHPPTGNKDKNRQALNTMIRNYVAKTNKRHRICLVDLDKGIPYHRVINDEERKRIWDDGIHLKPAGYDRMAKLVFDAIKSK